MARKKKEKLVKLVARSHIQHPDGHEPPYILPNEIFYMPANLAEVYLLRRIAVRYDDLPESLRPAEKETAVEPAEEGDTDGTDN